VSGPARWWTELTGSQRQGAVRAGWGLVLLTAPGPFLRLDGTAGDDPGARLVCRVLGARHLAQAAVEWWRKEPEVAPVPLGAVVDGLHAASMVGWAALGHRHRRFALLETLTASTFAAADLWSAGGS
jgi:hypothetical protein